VVELPPKVGNAVLLLLNRDLVSGVNVLHPQPGRSVLLFAGILPLLFRTRMERLSLAPFA